MSEWVKFSSVSHSKKDSNDVFTFRFSKDSVEALFGAFQAAVETGNGAVFVASIGKKGNQEHLNGAMLIREKQDVSSASFKKKFRVKENNEVPYKG